MDKVKVLVVDDSAFARTTISKALKEDPSLEVVGLSKDGIEAVEHVKHLRPDVVTLDVAMPRLDGIQALDRIMSECPTPVVMLSALTGDNTHATIEALERGAVDFFLKPSAISPVGTGVVADDLLKKVKMAAKVPVSVLTPPFKSLKPPKPTRRRIGAKDKVIVIGSSTGGPRALASVLPMIAEDIQASFLIVQHMPAGFTKTLASRLDQASVLTVREARDGDRISNGTALVAPGGYHMTVEKSGRIGLNQDPPVNGVRPSADVTMRSVAKSFGDIGVGVILTGMGSDGTAGALAMKDAGGKVVAEHESTCTIYGMSRSVIEAGHADVVAPLQKIANEIADLAAK